MIAYVKLQHLVDGSVSAEVIALDAEGMIKEGRELSCNCIQTLQ